MPEIVVESSRGHPAAAPSRRYLPDRPQVGNLVDECVRKAETMLLRVESGPWHCFPPFLQYWMKNKLLAGVRRERGSQPPALAPRLGLPASPIRPRQHRDGTENY